MKLFILFGLVALAHSLSDTTSTAIDFCNLKACGATPSIACSFTQKIDLWCDGKIIPLDSTALLTAHNTYRQNIAKGSYAPQYPTAARMAEMQWSDELAQMALYNVKRCQFSHDQCRDTATFKYSGQNIAMSQKYGYTWNYADEANKMVDNWFNEYKICDKSYIAKYYSSSKMVGHFTQVVKDSATHVGCAAVFYKDGDWDTMILACNYARTNMIGEPTYVSGNTGSKCTKASTKYPGLCLVY